MGFRNTQLEIDKPMDNVLALLWNLSARENPYTKFVDALIGLSDGLFAQANPNYIDEDSSPLIRLGRFATADLFIAGKAHYFQYGPRIDDRSLTGYSYVAYGGKRLEMKLTDLMALSIPKREERGFIGVTMDGMLIQGAPIMIQGFANSAERNAILNGGHDGLEAYWSLTNEQLEGVAHTTQLTQQALADPALNAPPVGPGAQDLFAEL